MKIVILGAALAAALPAVPAEAAAKHKWWMVNYSAGTCEFSAETPEGMYKFASTPAAHLAGFSMDKISPENVTKTAAGEIHVHMTGVRNGDPVQADYFTAKAECDTFVSENGVKAEQAPSSDIN